MDAGRQACSTASRHRRRQPWPSSTIGRASGLSLGSTLIDAVPAGLGEDRLDVGNALLAVALGDQRHIFGADGFGEGCATIVPGRMIGVRQRADRIDDGWRISGISAARDDGWERTDNAKRCGTFQKAPARDWPGESRRDNFLDHLINSSRVEMTGAAAHLH